MQFSIYRVWLLSKKQWTENQQLYLLTLLGMAGMMALAFLFHSSENSGLDYNAQEAVLLAGAGIGGAVFTSTILSQFNDKNKGIQALTLPASAGEKLVTAIIYSQIIFPVAYFAATYPVLCIIHYVDTYILGHTNRLYDLRFANRPMVALMLLVILQTAVLMCSVLFKRYTIIKTAVIILIVFFGSMAINPMVANKVLDYQHIKIDEANLRTKIYDASGKIVKDTMIRQKLATPQISNAFPFSDIYMYNFIDEKKGAFPAGNLNLADPYNTNLTLAQTDATKNIFVWLLCLSIPFAWLITWFRLKEIQL